MWVRDDERKYTLTQCTSTAEHELSNDLAFFVTDPKLDQAILYLDKRTHSEAKTARSMVWFDIRDCRGSGTELFFDRITPPDMPWLRDWRSATAIAPNGDAAVSVTEDESWDSMTDTRVAVAFENPPSQISLRGLTIASHLSMTVSAVLMSRLEAIKISVDHLLVDADLYPDHLDSVDEWSLENLLGIFCERSSELNCMWAAYIPELFSEGCIKRLEFTGNLWRSDARAQRKTEAIEKLSKIPRLCSFYATEGKRQGLVLGLERKWSYSQSDLHIIIHAHKLPHEGGWGGDGPGSPGITRFGIS